jgi:hypothetical protein
MMPSPLASQRPLLTPPCVAVPAARPDLSAPKPQADLDPPLEPWLVEAFKFKRPGLDLVTMALLGLSNRRMTAVATGGHFVSGAHYSFSHWDDQAGFYEKEGEIDSPDVLARCGWAGWAGGATQDLASFGGAPHPFHAPGPRGNLLVSRRRRLVTPQRGPPRRSRLSPLPLCFPPRRP